MSESNNIAHQIAKTLFAMSAKKRDKDIVKSLDEERYQRSWTDEMHRTLGMTRMEYDIKYRKRAGFSRVSEEQKKSWEELARRGE